MSAFDVVKRFSEASQRVTTVSELHDLIEDATTELGFNYFALVHHVDLKAPPGGAIKIDNYPTSWFETLVERRYYIDDPIHAATQKTALGFKWSDVGEHLDLTVRQQDILRHAKREGLGDGFSVPVHIPGEFTGSCSFGVRVGQSLQDDVLPTAHVLASFAFEAARKLNRRTLASMGIAADVQDVRLTQRQRECVILMSQGKSDWEIGKILNISRNTAHKHIEAAKQKFSVSTRQQLLMCALYTSELTFGDAFTRQVV